MQVKSTSYTIAQYCDQMKSGTIRINREYQRSPTVWPPAARSYLIDTILLGYPIPKISLYQKTDLRSRLTVYEIVDGQQRSKAILDFFDGNFRITGPSSFSGKRYADLEEVDQQKFIEYHLDADLFVAGTDDEIRQMFRRINSYTVPLNPEEQRHATHQGAFKWFIVRITEAYAPTLKMLGVFSERNLSRMQDAKLFTELALALDMGITTYSTAKLDKFYKEHDEAYPAEREFREWTDKAFDRILAWEDLHGSALMKPYNFYSLLLALIHRIHPVPVFQGIFELDGPGIGDNEVVEANLGFLANALEQDDAPNGVADFVEACSKATNTKAHREKRFQWLCSALGADLLM